MASLTRSAAILLSCSLLLLASSSPSQTNGFLPPSNRRKTAERKKKSIIMNEGSTSSLFPPTSKFHPNQEGLSNRRRWLVVDFDGTCTEHDTTPLLPRLAAFATRSRSSMSKSDADADADGADENDTTNGNFYNHQKDLSKRLEQFQQLENEFMERYREARSTMFSNSNNNDVPTTLYDVLEALDEPSNIVTGMVSASRCLSGLGHADTKEVEGMLNLHGISDTDSHTRERTLEYDNKSEDKSDDKVVVRLRHGCVKTLARILLDNKSNSNDDSRNKDGNECFGWSMAVLSINWSPALIDACLVQPLLRSLRLKSRDIEVPIWSNEVDREGVVTLHVAGAMAKRDKIMELKKDIKQGCDQTQSVIVYVGDSATDLAALLVADVGIIMGNSSSLIQIAESWGIEIAPLKHRHKHEGFQRLVGIDTSEESAEKKILWQVDTWQEIDEALQEIDRQWTRQQFHLSLRRKR